MCWQALQAGQTYVQQHLLDAQLSVDELQNMVGYEGEVSSNQVLHYVSGLHGIDNTGSSSIASL